ncbi:MAG TPA: hypothetical protein VKR55_07065, partial [Bradyrhizobium sp.]|uniref:hypothetical protein n=1 Tax=Bradyrhizobium sp. TaxID=376 RepID=UPI002CD208F9
IVGSACGPSSSPRSHDDQTRCPRHEGRVTFIPATSARRSSTAIGTSPISSRTGDIDKLKDVRQVVCVSVMTHEIPAYPLFIRTILENARVADIVPISIFDLKVAATYLSNAFDFVYYFATRSILDAYLMYGTEAALLAFHLTRRLTLPDRFDRVLIDDSFGQSIDADYPNRERKLSLRFGVKIVDEIIEDIIHSGSPEFFRLFSVLRGMSGRSAKDASTYLKRIEKMHRQDGQPHDATMLFNDIALTFIVANDPVAARARFDAIRQKRELEVKYAQEYVLTLSPRDQPHSPRKRFDGSSHHFAIRALAMRQNNAIDDGLLAFSPRIRDEDWEIDEEPDSTQKSADQA